MSVCSCDRASARTTACADTPAAAKRSHVLIRRRRVRERQRVVQLRSPTRPLLVLALANASTNVSARRLVALAGAASVAPERREQLGRCRGDKVGRRRRHHAGGAVGERATAWGAERRGGRRPDGRDVDVGARAVERMGGAAACRRAPARRHSTPRRALQHGCKMISSGVSGAAVRRARLRREAQGQGGGKVRIHARGQTDGCGVPPQLTGREWAESKNPSLHGRRRSRSRASARHVVRCMLHATLYPACCTNVRTTGPYRSVTRA